MADEIRYGGPQADEGGDVSPALLSLDKMVLGCHAQGPRT